MSRKEEPHPTTNDLRREFRWKDGVEYPYHGDTFGYMSYEEWDTITCEIEGEMTYLHRVLRSETRGSSRWLRIDALYEDVADLHGELMRAVPTMLQRRR